MWHLSPVHCHMYYMFLGKLHREPAFSTKEVCDLISDISSYIMGGPPSATTEDCNRQITKRTLNLQSLTFQCILRVFKSLSCSPQQTFAICNFQFSNQQHNKWCGSWKLAVLEPLNQPLKSHCTLILDSIDFMLGSLGVSTYFFCLWGTYKAGVIRYNAMKHNEHNE